MARDEWRFAPAQPRDAAAMRALAHAAYEKYVARIGREPGPMVADYETIAGSGQALLVWQGTELVGYLVTELEADALLIENVAVSPDQQGSGLGSLLVANAEEQARAAGKPSMRLYTHETMTENIEFYTRRGFVETHRATEHGFTRVFMSKDLRIPKLGVLARVLAIVIALVNVGDIALHVAIDQVEPFRVTGNVVVILATVGILAVGALRRPAVPIAAAVVNLTLNVVFIIISGIGGLGAVLIALTTILLATLGGALRPIANRASAQ